MIVYIDERKKSMKKLIMHLMCAAAMTAAALGMSITAAAEDVNIDCSSAVESTSWGQSLTVNKSQFDAERITKDSVVKVAFDAGDYTGDVLPIELIFQSWNNTTSPKADKKGGVWAKITTDDKTESSATFTYDQIVEAYGTDDFSEVQAIHVGDTDQAPVICKGLMITNCNKAKETIDVSVDCSEAKKASLFGTSFTVRYTTFDSTTLTGKSKVLVGYTADDESELTKAPVAIALQSWENSNSPYADDKGNVWVTVQPSTWGDGYAEFTYDAFVEAYGTADFSKLSAINFCDNGETGVIVNEVTFTECVSADKGTHIDTEAEDDRSAADEDSSTVEAEQESSTAETTAAPAAVTDSSSDSSEKKGSNAVFMVIGIVAGVAIAIAVIFLILTKQSSQEYDIDKRRMVSKKKPKNKAKW